MSFIVIILCVTNILIILIRWIAPAKKLKAAVLHRRPLFTTIKKDSLYLYGYNLNPTMQRYGAEKFPAIPKYG